MTSVTARDQRLEQERQRALQQQLLALRERTLAEEIRAAGVAEDLAERQFGLLSDEQEYQRSLARPITFTTDEGQEVTGIYTPEQQLAFIRQQESPSALRMADLAERQLERQDLLRNQLSEAIRFFYTGDRTDTELRDYFVGLDPEVQASLEREFGTAIQTRTGAGMSPIEGPLYVTDPATGGRTQIAGTGAGAGARTRGLGTIQARYGAPDPYQTIFDPSVENALLRAATGATRSAGEGQFTGYVQQAVNQQPDFTQTFARSAYEPAPTPFNKLTQQDLSSYLYDTSMQGLDR